MSDLISRQELRRAMYHEAMEKDSDEQKWDSGCWIRYKMFERVIDSMPSVQPEIIRCKDCYLRYTSCPMVVRIGNILEFFTQDNDFCSRAQRE